MFTQGFHSFRHTAISELANNGVLEDYALAPHRFEEAFVRRPHSGEPIGFDRDTFLGAEIAHDWHHQRANLILLLEDGRIIERGTHDELMRASERF